MEALVQRLEQAVTRLESVSIKMQTPEGVANGDMANGINGVSQCVEAFDLLLEGPVSDYLRTSQAIGEDVETHAQMVKTALKVQRNFVKMASAHQQPAQAEMGALLKPISDQIQLVQRFREQNRGSQMFNHLSAVSESIPALGWVTVCMKPGPYVKEMNDAAMFYTNRVLKDYKETDKRHVDWVRSYLNIWTELQAYIKQHHTTGLSWSQNGPKAPPSPTDTSYLAPMAPPPPPPPRPPPPPPPCTEQPKSDSSARHSALFAQLNQGEDITKGLKHISDAQKTHKNPGLRPPSGVATPPVAHKPASEPKATPLKSHAPLLELEGKKWRVEYQNQAPDLLISDTELRQVAYVFSCTNSTLQIKGKVNSIILDSCKKMGVVFDSAVGIVEIINCKDIQLQVMGTVPTISINKTDGCHVYLSQDALTCEIISAKSSEMNILLPQGDDYREFPVPEQFKTVWDGSRLVTEPTEIAG
ncbi:hypothetical protein SKAU_G00407470 [Synaphobranchus kaupii]|uniref:Adenylyl cyclase-associated protein n=1 Tax=Synaphobranchus kaupii TaxID=118154 RepID=A0A9Q1EAA7_SYNKA|nr:hypothetical protein SKAU_G00407470 [Synaphobranchus kaupii]